MKVASIRGAPVKSAATLLLAVSCLALAGFGSVDKSKPNDAPIPLTVPKAVCGPNDHPETGLQGQVSAALRAAGFKGFNCNLELISQVRDEGANWQSAEFKDGNHRICAYHGTASPTLSPPGRQHLGVPVIDITNATNPSTTAYLTTTSMLDPWESLKVNERRKLLAADNGQNGGGGPEVDIYDISSDCTQPQLLASLPVGTGSDGGTMAKVVGHEGAWAPDGLTYYGGDLRNAQYYAVDTADPVHPKLITNWKPGIANVHGMSISDDGTRGYFVSLGSTPGAGLTDPNVAATNGLLIYDISAIQARNANPSVKLLGKVLWKDGSVAQHTIPVKIGGKPYIVAVDEGGSGGGTSPAQLAAACAAGLPPFPMARIIDISDETNPKIVSRLMTEVHDPANCSRVIPDLVGLSIFTYGTHYCSVDNRHHATTLACGMFNSGIRVFDIRDPLRPKEIAYYNPAGTTDLSKGSNHPLGNNWKPGGPDWCSAQVHLDRDRGTLWTTCQDNGLLMLKFTNGAWPFPESATPPGEQN
jgi:hypothetical protein